MNYSQQEVEERIINNEERLVKLYKEQIKLRDYEWRVLQRLIELYEKRSEYIGDEIKEKLDPI